MNITVANGEIYDEQGNPIPDGKYQLGFGKEVSIENHFKENNEQYNFVDGGLVPKSNATPIADVVITKADEWLKSEPVGTIKEPIKIHEEFGPEQTKFETQQTELQKNKILLLDFLAWTRDYKKSKLDKYEKMHVNDYLKEKSK